MTPTAEVKVPLLCSCCRLVPLVRTPGGHACPNCDRWPELLADRPEQKHEADS